MVAPIVWGVLALIGILGAIGVAKAVGVPKRPAVTEEEIERVELTTEEKLIAMAMKELKLSRSELTVRSLLPCDLGLTSWDYTPAAPGYNNMVNTTLADNTFIAITGVSYPEPVATADISGIRITAAGAISELWNIQPIWGLETPIFMDSTPLIVKQNRPITISVNALTGGVAETLSFIGIVVEPVGVTIA